MKLGQRDRVQAVILPTSAGWHPAQAASAFDLQSTLAGDGGLPVQQLTGWTASQSTYAV
jgi:hypothetical protein